MGKKMLIKWLGMFLAVMIIFTVLSQAARSVSVARVQVKSMQNQLMVHTVSGTGKIEGTKEYAVFTLENQKVERVLVQPGQAVKKGDVLMCISQEGLDESIEEKEKEIAELEAAVQDLESSEAVKAQTENQEISSARENLDMAVSDGEINIANAQNALDTARQRLREYDSSQEGVFSDGTQETDTASERQALEEDIRAKEEALTQAILSRNRDVASARQSVENAALPQASDSSLSNARRNLEFARKEQTELLELKEKKGKIKSPVNGTVKELIAGTGSITSQGAVVTLYEKKGKLRMTGTITKDDLQYAEIGAAVSLEGSGGNKTDDGVIASITEDETDENKRILSVELPKDAFAIGENVEFTIRQEEGPYSTCIPLSALYEQSGQFYVYVIETSDSVLGEQLTARKVFVTVQDKNESTAVLQSGNLSGDQKVIVDTDREITDGSPVRLQES